MKLFGLSFTNPLFRTVFNTVFFSATCLVPPDLDEVAAENLGRHVLSFVRGPGSLSDRFFRRSGAWTMADHFFGGGILVLCSDYQYILLGVSHGSDRN